MGNSTNIEYVLTFFTQCIINLWNLPPHDEAMATGLDGVKRRTGKPMEEERSRSGY